MNADGEIIILNPVTPDLSSIRYSSEVKHKVICDVKDVYVGLYAKNLNKCCYQNHKYRSIYIHFKNSALPNLLIYLCKTLSASGIYKNTNNFICNGVEKFSENLKKSQLFVCKKKSRRRIFLPH